MIPQSTIRNPQSTIKLRLPVALYTGVIFWLSSESRPIPGIETFPQIDKVCHFLEYIPLGFLWVRALRHSLEEKGKQETKKIPWGKICFWTFVAASGTGILDEWYQGSIPGKETDLFDWAADFGGIALGQALYLWRRF